MSVETVKASVLHGERDLRLVSKQTLPISIRKFNVQFPSANSHLSLNPQTLPKSKLTKQQEERSLPPPSADEVQIAVQSTGLCGSDLHYFGHYRNGDILVREPLTLGHESSGTVVAVGSDVSNLKPGDRVALEVGLPCESCEYCASGRYNICRGMKFRSSAKAFPHMQGTLQERINHPARWVHK